MRRRLVILLIAFLIFAAVAWRVWRWAGGVGQPPPPTSRPAVVPLAGGTMGGTWSVKLGRLPPGVSPGQVTAAVQDVLDRVEGETSTYRPTSDLSRFNQY